MEEQYNNLEFWTNPTARVKMGILSGALGLTVAGLSFLLMQMVADKCYASVNAALHEGYTVTPRVKGL